MNIPLRVMPQGSAEITEVHTRLLKCALCVDESRAYWSHVDPDAPANDPAAVFEAGWFGRKSERWVDVLLINMRARFAAFPDALWVLSRWRNMAPEQLASRLLSCALGAGLIRGKRDPREVIYPRVPDEALGYLLYLLRAASYSGSLVDNPYLRSIALQGDALEDRLRMLPSVQHHRIGNVQNLEWRYPDLRAWAQASVLGGAT
jgi:hypothetical protein